MKKIIFLLLTVHTLNIFSQKNTDILVTIDDEKVSVEDFKRIYERNLDAIDNEESKDVNKNLNLFINFKLKVKQAYELKLDTLTSYTNEINTYRKQLIAPYIQDENQLKSLVKEAYDRTRTEISASHILVMLPRNYKPKDTLLPFSKITEARNRVIAGESFKKVAVELSEDPSAKKNGGNLGYFSAFNMLYDFEDVAYKTSLGDVSQIFKTRFGYHILQKTGSRTSKGERQVAHILISDTTSNGKKLIDEVHVKLKNGAIFKELALKYSNDSGSKRKGGVLPKFGYNRMVKPFESAAYSLDSIDQISMPFKTKYGWHIIKLIKKYPILPFEELKKEISQKVKNTGRVKLSSSSILKRLKNEYLINITQSVKESLQNNNFEDSLESIFLTINKKKITKGDFVAYRSKRSQTPLSTLLKNFINEEILAYYKENLVHTNKEFSSTLAEYQDGLLLFELMQQKIWNISSDSIALNTYFIAHKNSYETNDLESIKGKVMNDFQTTLDREWIQELRSKSIIKINKKVLKKVINYYRKES